jgi:hypothetical protein
MAKKIINLLILLPLGIILIIFCVANRQSVTLAFNPFRPEDRCCRYRRRSSCSFSSR